MKQKAVEAAGHRSETPNGGWDEGQLPDRQDTPTGWSGTPIMPRRAHERREADLYNTKVSSPI